MENSVDMNREQLGKFLEFFIVKLSKQSSDETLKTLIDAYVSEVPEIFPRSELGHYISERVIKEIVKGFLRSKHPNSPGLEPDLDFGDEEEGDSESGNNEIYSDSDAPEDL